jgi:hypothetical protein
VASIKLRIWTITLNVGNVTAENNIEATVQNNIENHNNNVGNEQVIKLIEDVLGVILHNAWHFRHGRISTIDKQSPISTISN